MRKPALKNVMSETYAQARKAFEDKWFEDHRPVHGISRGHLDQAMANAEEEFHGHIDASFPELDPLPKFDPGVGVMDAVAFAKGIRDEVGARWPDPRKPEYIPYAINLSRFGNVPVSTVLETLEILGLELQPVMVARR